VTHLDLWRAAIDDASFEETLRALDEVVAYLQDGKLTLDDAVSSYQIGVDLTLRCEHLLHNAEIRISLVEDTLANADKNEAACDDGALPTDDEETS